MVSIGFLLVRVLSTHTATYWFLAWNLLLAWLPLLFSWWLVLRLPNRRWFSPLNVLLTILWLGFLPNTFYIASDIIHLKATGGISILFDVTMMLSFTWNGFLLGYTSVYLIHQQLKKRLGRYEAHSLIAFVFLLVSFAIYLGRYLRWNSWDVLINPAGLLFDVSDSFVNPSSHPRAFTTTLMFFVLTTSIYAVGYQLAASVSAAHETE